MGNSYDNALQTVSQSLYNYEFEPGITSADAAVYDVAASVVEIATGKQPAFFTTLMKWLKPAFSMWLGRPIPKWQAHCVLGTEISGSSRFCNEKFGSP